MTKENLPIRLHAMRGILNQWLEFDRAKRDLERLETTDDTHIMGPPHWPSHGQVRAWISALDEATTVDRAAAEPELPPGRTLSAAAARRLLRCAVGVDVIRQKSAQDLVDLALEHLTPSGDMGMLLLHELCSRVNPGWEKEEPGNDGPCLICGKPWYSGHTTEERAACDAAL